MSTEADNDSFIRILNLSKRFGDFVAVDDVSLDIRKGELFTILGGSGCGKTTLLRMLAGLEAPSSGRIEIDGSDVTRQPAYERPVNMMFQSYAVFPHMNVEENIAYGLVKDRVGKAEIADRVGEMLKLVQLGDFGKRRPNQLSGGQLQRVALARALIKRPKVLLLDEPLAALDKKLRERTQFELMNIQYELGITFVVVTHDQEEAMTVSSRIAVMDEGRFRQVGTPRQIYEYPANRFVADFIGTINTFDGEVASVDEDSVTVRCDGIGETLTLSCDAPTEVGQRVQVAVRPEKIFISKNEPENEEGVRLSGVVDDFGYFGNRSLYRIRLPKGQIIQVSAQNRKRSASRFIDWEDEVWISWRPKSTLVLTE